MTPPLTTPTAEHDPVRAALADPVVLARMAAAAGAVLRARLAHLMATERAAQIQVAVNDAAVLALRCVDRYNPSAGDPAAWLAGFARNAARDIARTYQLQAARFGPCPELDDLAADTNDPSGPMADAESMAARLAGLPPRDREILVLKYADGLEFAEIGRRLGMSAGAVRVRVCRAIKQLRAADGRGVRP